MEYARKRLIGVGILVLLAGVILGMIATAISTALFSVMGSVDGMVSFLAELVLGVLRFGVAPLGAVMIAIGIALYWLENGQAAEKLEAATDREQRQTAAS